MSRTLQTAADANPGLLYNLTALFTVSMWGMTFVSTKMLISYGLTPTWIFISRFVLAYLCVLAVSRRRLWADNLKDELMMLALGLTGGSVYFIAENTALRLTFASNVSLIICSTPVLTMILGRLFCKDSIPPRAAAGSLLAIAGVTAVILNGSMNFGLSPAGDLLTLLASLLWATYCIVLKKMGGRYSNLFITRKCFFYGWATALLFALAEPLPTLPSRHLWAPALLNILFLAIIASFLCYILWGKTVKVLGPERAASYIYFSPLVTVLASSLILGEPVTAWMLAGGAAIISGVCLISR